MNFYQKLTFHNQIAYIGDNFSENPPYPKGTKYVYAIQYARNNSNEHTERIPPIAILNTNKFESLDTTWGFLAFPKKLRFPKGQNILPLTKEEQKIFLGTIKNLKELDENTLELK